VIHPARDERRGLLLVLLSTVAFGILPILGKTAYGAGVGVLPLLAWRYVVAAVLFALLLRKEAPPWRTRLRLWGIGTVFVFNSIAYFLALVLIPASTASLLIFSYPVIVALLAAAVGLERLTLRSLLAAGLAFAGCALTVAGAGGARALLEAGPGALLALLAALLYASYVILASRFARDVKAHVLAQHLAQVSALVCILLALGTGGLAIPLAARAWLPVLGAGVVSTVFAFFAFLAGMALIGPTRASVVSSFEVVVTVALAFVLLGERLTPLQGAGAALILGAVVWQSASALRKRMPRALVPPEVARESMEAATSGSPRKE
jgi:drug/metabolite transporter (DMT)-like permease